MIGKLPSGWVGAGCHWRLRRYRFPDQSPVRANDDCERSGKGTLDDLQFPGPNVGHDLGHPGAAIAGIGEYLDDRGEAAGSVAQLT